MAHTNVRLKNSVRTQLLQVVFLLYLSVAVSLTLVQMYVEYQEAQQGVKEDLKTFQISFERSVADALWDMDDEYLSAAGEGVVKNPAIIGVSIDNNEGKRVYERGTVEDPQILSQAATEGPSKTISGVLGVFWHTFTVFHVDDLGEKRNLGKITLYSSDEIVFKKVKNGFFVIILNSIIKTVILWGIFLVATRVLITQPLSVLTSAIEKIDLDHLNDFEPVNIGISRTNELKLLEQTFNTMANKLRVSKQSLETANRQIILEHEYAIQAEKDKVFAQKKEIEAQKEILFKNRLLEHTHRHLESLKKFVQQNVSPVDRDTLYISSEFPYCIVTSATGKPDRIFKCKLDEIEELDAHQPEDVMKLMRIGRNCLVVASKIIGMVRDTKRKGNVKLYCVTVRQNNKIIELNVSQRYEKMVRAMLKMMDKEVVE